MPKSPDAFRTISEVADWLGIQAHVLRFWESKFTQIKPVKRAGGRRYYRPADMQLIGGIKKLLHDDGLSIKDVQQILKDQGVAHVSAMSPPLEDGAEEDAHNAPGPAVASGAAAAGHAGLDGAADDAEDDADDAPLPDSAEVLTALNAGPGGDEDDADDDAGTGGSPHASAPPLAAEAEPPLAEAEPPVAEPEQSAPEAEDQPLQAQLDLSPPEPALDPEPEDEPPAEAAQETLVDDVLAAAAPDSPDAEHLTAPAPDTPEPEPAAPERAAEAALEIRPDADVAAGPAAEAAEDREAGLQDPAESHALLLENPAGLPGDLTLPPGSQLLSRLPRVSRIPAPVRAEVEACAAELRAWLDRH